MDSAETKIHFELLNRLTNLVVCSSCFQAGRLTPVAQVVSAHHRPKTLCQECSAETGRHELAVLTRLNA
jgi:superfamily II helicase